MYEPTRARSVRPPRSPSPSARTSSRPQPGGEPAGPEDSPGQPVRATREESGPVPRTPSRAEHLDAQLAGHLAALLMVTEALRSAAPSPEIDEAARQIADRISTLSPHGAPALIWEGNQPREGDAAELSTLHTRAHNLAGRVLVVAASRQDTTTAMLACLRMDAHAKALKAAPLAA